MCDEFELISTVYAIKRKKIKYIEKDCLYSLKKLIIGSDGFRGPNLPFFKVRSIVLGCRGRVSFLF